LAGAPLFVVVAALALALILVDVAASIAAVTATPVSTRGAVASAASPPRAVCNPLAASRPCAALELGDAVVGNAVPAAGVEVAKDPWPRPDPTPAAAVVVGGATWESSDVLPVFGVAPAANAPGMVMPSADVALDVPLAVSPLAVLPLTVPPEVLPLAALPPTIPALALPFNVTSPAVPPLTVLPLTVLPLAVLPLAVLPAAAVAAAAAAATAAAKGVVEAGEGLPGAGNCSPLDPPSCALLTDLRAGALEFSWFNADAKSLPLGLNAAGSAGAAPLVCAALLDCDAPAAWEELFVCAASLFTGAREIAGIEFIPVETASDVPSAAGLAALGYPYFRYLSNQASVRCMASAL
jgi:hypothetical protein